MKKYKIEWVTSILFALLFFISIVYNFKYIHIINKQRDTITQLSYEIKTQEKALELSDSIMNNNELYDKDGSDIMSDYLQLRDEINDNNINNMSYIYK